MNGCFPSSLVAGSSADLSHGGPLGHGDALLKCPECTQVFDSVVCLYSHASHSHYWNILASLFMSDFLLTNSKCIVCPKSEKIKSVNAYIKHMGGKHRLILKFMTPELRNDYAKFPTTQAEYDDVQALLEIADQPEGHLKKVKEKASRKEKCSQDNFPTNAAMIFPGSPLCYGLSSMHSQSQTQLEGLDVSQFLSMAQFQQQTARQDHPEGLNSGRPAKLTKKGRVRRTVPHDPYKCPECDNFFDHMSTLYAHSAGKHYYNQLVDHYKANFMRSNGMCEACPNRPINDVQSYVTHVGGKHKLIHQLMAPEVLREYEKLPSKRTNAGYTTVKNSVSVNCLICGPNTKRKFANITEYKQHLAIFHFRNQISATYLSTFASGSMELTCAVCELQPGLRGRVFKSSQALIVHLGSKHNCILDFADDQLLGQLHSFNVYKN